MSAFKSRLSTALKFSLLAIVVHGCTEVPSLEEVLVRPTSMAATGSTTYSAVAGSTRSEPAQVTVRDQGGEALPNQAVSFTASRGTLSSGTANTNADGRATPATWTAPTQAGPATITAAIPGFASIPPVTFNITVTAAAAATQTKTASTDNLSAVAGSATASAPEVTVVDQFGNGVSGVVVTFTIQTGGGTLNGSSLTTANVTTDANGRAKLTSWVLGGTIGTNTVRATTTVLPAQALTFTATGTAGPPNNITIAPPGNSQAQTATAGSNVAVAPAVLVRDQGGNPLSNVTVRFAINVGGGKVISSTGAQVTQVDVATNAQGIATSFGWMVWDLGTNSLAVTIPAVSTVPAFAITATSVAGPPTQIAVVTETPSSNNQTAAALATVAVAPGVVVKDANGFVVANTSVTFTVGANSGVIKVSSGSAEVTTAAINTDANGVARLFSWKLGPNKGANTLTAALTASAGVNVTFTATGVAGPPASIAVVTESPSSNNQSTVANTAVAVAPGVVVRDANNLTVDAGVSITFAIQTGGGVVSATGCTGTATSVTVNTDANGVARLGCWKPGTVGSNANTMRASVTGTPAIFVNFTATGTVGAPTNIAVENQGWPFTRATLQNGGVPKVKVTDAGGNGVAGLTINWSNNGNASSTVGGTLTSVTDVNGVAQFQGTQGGTWTAAAAASGTLMQLLATVASAPGITQLLTSTIVTAPTQVQASTSPSATTPVNTNAAPGAVATVRDNANRPVPGVAVNWSITANPGGTSTATLTGSTTATDSVGQSAAGTWKVASTAGVNTIAAGVPAIPTSLSFNTTGTAGAATQIATNAGTGQTASTGAAVTTAPAVLVRDQFNNPVSGASVTFSPTTGSGSVTGSPALTNASGIATVGSWTLGSTPGTHTLNAFITGQAAITTAFTATAVDPCQTQASHSVPSTFNGALAASDCNIVESGTTRYIDYHQVVVPSATTRLMSMTYTGSTFGPELRSEIYPPSTSYWYNNSASPGSVVSYYVLGPGTYKIGATSTAGTTTGNYTLQSSLNPAMPSGCGNFLTTKNVTVTTHTLQTGNCTYTYNGGSSTVASRVYLIYLPANQTLSMTVSGPSVDWYLEAYDVTGSGRTFLTSADAFASGGSETLSVTSSTSNRFLELRVAHWQSQSLSPGAYTYTVNIP